MGHAGLKPDFAPWSTKFTWAQVKSGPAQPLDLPSRVKPSLTQALGQASGFMVVSYFLKKKKT